MNTALNILLAALIGSLLVINFFLGQLIITLITYFSQKTSCLRKFYSNVPDRQDRDDK